MKEKLEVLYNTLTLIETRGESTLIMADCLKHLGGCIAECEIAEVTEEKAEQKEKPEPTTE